MKDIKIVLRMSVSDEFKPDVYQSQLQYMAEAWLRHVTGAGKCDTSVIEIMADVEQVPAVNVINIKNANGVSLQQGLKK